MTKDDLVTFMCGGVASAMTGDASQAFWDGLDAARGDARGEGPANGPAARHT